MTRYEFLKKAGFSGGALFAILASCVKEEDKYINAASLNPDGTISAATTTTTTTGTTTGVDTKSFITTEALNKITGVKLKLDLTEVANSKLKVSNNYRVVSSIVVALSKTGQYIAATITCTHEPLKQITYYDGEWYCTAHGARFSEVGKGLNKNGSKGLTIYKTATDGKTLIVY